MEGAMTIHRRDGNDSPFGAWLRRQPELSSQHFVASDIDWVIHRYKPEIDSVGSREVNYMMFVEVKTFSANLTPSQHESLWFQHQFFQAKQGKKLLMLVGGKSRRAVWHFGVSVLVFTGHSPEDSQIKWGRFISDGSLTFRDITKHELVRLLRFDLHPDILNPMSARRHHKTRRIEHIERTELGFETPRRFISRS
jgi:hypothetical protein